jgi:TRAP-type uncharacterized transport system fused permease subunit
LGCVAGITLLAAALSGYMFTLMRRWEVLVCVLAALLLIAPGLMPTLIGLAMAAPVVVLQWLRRDQASGP